MRQPRQIHVFLYRKGETGWEYAVFLRSNLKDCWQGVSGGVEDDETLEEAARRELWEEIGRQQALPLYPLECVNSFPAAIIGKKHAARWGENVILVPIHYFAVAYDGPIRLSEEHLEYRWLPYEAASALLYFPEQKTALYELNERILRGLISPNA